MQARRDGDHYVVNGAKTWITNSVEGHLLAVLVKTDARAEPPYKGMSLLLMEKGPGFNVTRRLPKLSLPKPCMCFCVRSISPDSPSCIAPGA